MNTRQDGDYWNESQTFDFNWDDDGAQIKDSALKKSTSLSSTIQSGSSLNISFESSQEPIIPLHTLISKENLTIILHDNAPKHLINQYSAVETVQRIMLNRPYSLETFRSLSRKTALLDAAIDIADGNAILTVMLYLSKTLKAAILYKLLSTRQCAINHYGAYLESRLCTSELTDLLMLTASNTGMMKIYQLLVTNTSNKDQLLRKLESFHINHQNVFEDSHDLNILKQHIRFLAWQRDNKVEYTQIENESVMTVLAKLCEANWGKTDNTNPLMLVKDQEVSQRQFEWVMLNARATLGGWNDIVTFFIKPNWMNKKSIKTSLSIEKIVLRLHRHGADVGMLEEFLNLIEDTDISLELGKRLHCHKFVINTLVSQRDRLALIAYKGHLTNNSDAFYIADNALRTLGKKWKN